MVTKGIFTFPNPVNEVSARVVAAGVVAMATATVASRRRWLIAPIAYGFFARALTGPTLSPLGQLATRVISLAALALAFPFKRTKAAFALVGMMAVFATLESGFGFCIGCKIFGVLMKLGVIPEEVCAECANIWTRPNTRTDAPVA
jgi:uncharacterized protein DUF4395